MDNFVMVPVPSDLVERVQQRVNWRMTSGIPADWDEDAVAELYGQLDDASRVVARTVAQGSVDDEPITVARAAAAAGTTTREALGIVLELVQRFRVLGGVTFPLMLLDAAEGVGDDQRVIVMPRDGARVVIAAAGRF
jgi:hypothetical protein